MEKVLLEIPEIIQANRIVLKLVKKEDAQEINGLICDSFEHLNRWFPWAKNPNTVEDTLKFCIDAEVKTLLREKLEYKIIYQSNIIGVIGVFNLDWEVGRAELGYWLAHTHWGSGFMPEAVRAVCQILFNEYKFNRVQIRADKDNVNSATVAKKCGFQLEGILRNYTKNNQGKVSNDQLFSLTSIDELC
jgi:RimJ/RimL family protein N-acetyltransferase